MRRMKILLIILTATALISCDFQASTQGNVARPEVAANIQKYLDNGFGMPSHETSWYANIKRVSVVEDIVEIQTDLPASGEKASAICGAVSLYIFDRTNPMGLEKVKVFGQNGVMLIHRRGLSDECR